MALLPYDTEEEAIALANETEYGLSGCVYSGDREARGRGGCTPPHRPGAHQRRERRLRGPLRRLQASRATVVSGASKGFEEFLETKALMGAFS